jgi:hypothetical protein
MRNIAFFPLLFAALLPARAQLNGVTAQLQLEQNQYMPDEDLQLKVRITNRSGQTVALGQDNQWITFEIVGERDRLVSKQGEMPVKEPFTLLSGQEAARPFNPTPYFDFRRPGRYHIGAVINIPQWNQQIACKPAFFTVSEGVPLPNLGDLQIGVPPPPGLTNVPPEVRRYSLIKVAYLDELKLYFRLTDKYGRTLRVFPLATMLSFSDPEAQIDRANNLHVLLQTGAKTFTYSVLDPAGNLIARQFHQYTQTRPRLSSDGEGQVFVAGGRRLLTLSDIPAPAPAPDSVKIR